MITDELQQEREEMDRIALEQHERAIHFELTTLLEQNRERGVALTHRELETVSRSFNWSGEMIMPLFIADFIVEALSHESPASVLDPWAGLGSLADIVATGVGSARVVTITPQQQELDIAAKLSQHPATERFAAAPMEQLDSISDRFGIVLACPPFGMRLQLRKAYRGTTLHDNIGEHIVLKACERLTPNGIAFCLLPPSFFFAAKPNVLRTALAQCGFRLDAALYLPPGAFAPVTTMSLYLVVIRRGEQQADMFVAELTPKSNFKQIADNWRERRPGKTLSLGIVTSAETFRSYPSLASQQRVDALVAKSNLTAIPLVDVSVEIKRADKKKLDGFEENPNAVYLPTIGNSAAVTRIADFRLKPQNYVQIVLNGEQVLAEYLARFFNTELGLLVRESLLSGTTIPKISLTTLGSAVIYASSLEMQTAQVDLAGNIRDLRSGLEALESQLWRHPGKVPAIKRVLEKMGQEDGSEAWSKSLPFPLASILRRHLTTRDKRQQKEHLLHFFEALAEFLTAVMLSAVRSNTAYLDEHRERIFGDEFEESFERFTFGLWCKLGARLAKATRDELSSGDLDRRNRTLDVYKCSATFVETLVNKKLWSVLEKANSYRNDWVGHSGVESDRETEQRVARLEDELSRARSAIGDIFEQVNLILPKTASYSDGVYSNAALVLSGSDPAFREEAIETTVPLDTKLLYLCEVGATEPLELVPLFRMLPSPETEQNACFFLNRLSDKEARWVSYHFEGQADITEPDELALANLFQSLLKGDQPSA
jgi:hypothetical protein